MKKIVYLILLFSILSCSEKIQTENGVGQLKLGMTKTQFEKQFPNTKLTADSYYHFFELIEFNNDLKLKNGRLFFINDSLAEIAFLNDNGQLLELLKKQNGIDTIIRTDKFETTLFKTKSKNLSCFYEKYHSKRIGAIAFINRPLLCKLNE